MAYKGMILASGVFLISHNSSGFTVCDSQSMMWFMPKGCVKDPTERGLQEYFMIPWKVPRPCLLCMGAQEIFFDLRNIEKNEATLQKAAIEPFLT